ncbi:hypothetical protein [Scytonema sp. NUACC26]|uniref:hypothetical protein n=1 Tax=Scytonema sp. NUACC26 TaxID=3140176 RepID=UPI0038B37B88
MIALTDALANYIVSSTGQQILAKYGFNSPLSVRECQGIGGILLAVSVAFALHRKLMAAKQQKNLSERSHYLNCIWVDI